MAEEVKNKYAVDCKGRSIDVYDVLNAFGVTCPAAQHAIKKLLMPGKREHKSELGDLLEARASVDRAIDLAHERKCIADAERERKAFDDCKGEPPNASPKASLCRECGGTKIDGVCQEKGCGYEAG